MVGDIPTRRLGRTGLEVSIVGFRCGHSVNDRIDEATTVRLVQEGIDARMTFMDNAWEYSDGEAERRMGIALEGRRDQVTLMTKVCARDKETVCSERKPSAARLAPVKALC